MSGKAEGLAALSLRLVVDRDGCTEDLTLKKVDLSTFTHVDKGAIHSVVSGEELDEMRVWVSQLLGHGYMMGKQAAVAEAFAEVRRDTLFLVLDAIISNDAAVKHATTVTDNPVQAAIDLLCKHNVKAFAEGKAAARDDLLHGLRREIELQKASLQDAEQARQRTERHLHFLEAAERYMQGLAGIEEGT